MEEQNNEEAATNPVPPVEEEAEDSNEGMEEQTKEDSPTESKTPASNEEDDEGLDDGPPSWVLCPISFQVMTDPVVVDSKCRHAFSRDALTEWLVKRGNQTCPLCATTLRSKEISPCSQLREAIEERMGLPPGGTGGGEEPETSGEDPKRGARDNDVEEQIQGREFITNVVIEPQQQPMSLGERICSCVSLYITCGTLLLCLILVVVLPALALAGHLAGNHEALSQDSGVDFPPPYTMEKISQDSSCPQAWALNWVEGHPEYERMPTWRKQQLLALTTYFFSTNEWLPSGDWRHWVHWLDYTYHECDWTKGHYNSFYQQTCDAEGKYQALVTSSNDGPITGTIPPELSLLTDLKELRLVGTHMGGSLPTEIGLMTALTGLWFPVNELSGSIPNKLADLKSLQYLHLGGNDMTGTIPLEVCFFLELQTIVVDCDSVTCPCSQCNCW